MTSRRPFRPPPPLPDPLETRAQVTLTERDLARRIAEGVELLAAHASALARIGEALAPHYAELERLGGSLGTDEAVQLPDCDADGLIWRAATGRDAPALAEALGRMAARMIRAGETG